MQKKVVRISRSLSMERRSARLGSVLIPYFIPQYSVSIEITLGNPFILIVSSGIFGQSNDPFLVELLYRFCNRTKPAAMIIKYPSPTSSILHSRHGAMQSSRRPQIGFNL